MAATSTSTLLKTYTVDSVARMALWRLQKCGHPLRMTCRSGAVIELRGGTHAHSDRWISSEIFLHDQYVPPPPIELNDIRQIVDVGANVGFSIVYFLSLFPTASVTAFEPHPKHVDQIRTHITLNNLQDRVVLHAAAAGVIEGTVYLTDSDATSSILPDRNDTAGVPVRLVDWYQLLPEGPIDLLKIDIEGAEFALMKDERFEAVIQRTKILTLEWHCTDEYQDAERWCTERVQSLGLSVYNGAIQYGSKSGTFWAARA